MWKPVYHRFYFAGLSTLLLFYIFQDVNTEVDAVKCEKAIHF